MKSQETKLQEKLKTRSKNALEHYKNFQHIWNKYITGFVRNEQILENGYLSFLEPLFLTPPYPPECFEAIASFSVHPSPFGWACFHVVILAPKHGCQVLLFGGPFSIFLLGI